MTYTITVIWPAGVTERQLPGTTSDGGGIIPAGTIVHATELVKDRDNPDDKTKRWAHLTDGKYIAVDYPNSKGPQVRATVTDDSGGTPNPPPPGPIDTTAAIRAHIELNDGTNIYSGDVQLNQKD